MIDSLDRANNPFVSLIFFILTGGTGFFIVKLSSFIFIGYLIFKIFKFQKYCIFYLKTKCTCFISKQLQMVNSFVLNVSHIVNVCMYVQ